MLTYNRLKNQRRRFLALTGLTLAEFEALRAAFQKAYGRIYPSTRTVTGQRRKRLVKAGRPGSLAAIEDKLLFVLVYLKTYPLQVVLGELFGMGTSQANYWLQRLLPVLHAALEDLRVLPERDGQRLVRMRCPVAELKTLIIDGTERRRQRPRNPEKQALFYSGKKKAHTSKNLIVANATSDRILFLSNRSSVFSAQLIEAQFPTLTAWRQALVLAVPNWRSASRTWKRRSVASKPLSTT